jgi:hypothetical protein
MNKHPKHGVATILMHGSDHPAILLKAEFLFDERILKNVCLSREKLCEKFQGI